MRVRVCVGGLGGNEEGEGVVHEAEACIISRVQGQ
jgi:hypothetical protein